MKLVTCWHCKRQHETTDAKAARHDYRCLDCERLRHRTRPDRSHRPPQITHNVGLDGGDPYIPVPESGCWLWLGLWTSQGYGRFSNGRRGTYRFAHRVAAEQKFGLIPNGMHVCHKCDTPACVNPDHLFLGTPKENTRDMWAKGRARPFGREPRPEVVAKYRAGGAA